MSFNLLQDCIDMDVDMAASSHAVLVVICRHANDAGTCFPSTALIAKKSHLNPRTVMQAVKELERDAWISCNQSAGKKRFFIVNAEKIKSYVTPAENCTPAESDTPAESYTPAGNCTPVENCSTPLQETAGDPCRKLQTNKKVISKEEVSYCDPASFETVSQSASDFGFGLEAEDFGGSTKTGSTNFGMAEEKPKKAAKKKAQTHRFDLDNLPEDWRKVAQDMRPDLDADKVFASFRFYWVSGRGEGTLRSDKSWATSWANWLRKEAEGNRRTMASPSAEPVGTNSTDPAELRRQYWALQKQKKEAEEREAALIFGVAA